MSEVITPKVRSILIRRVKFCSKIMCAKLIECLNFVSPQNLKGTFILLGTGGHLLKKGCRKNLFKQNLRIYLQDILCIMEKI